MTQEITQQRELLTRLVAEMYDCPGAMLQVISPHLLEERGIYRVKWENGASAVLRAFSGDVTAELRAHAAVLNYLQERSFPAPQVKPTRHGELLASYAGWTALLVSYIEGEVAEFTPESLELLGKLTGSLHTLSRNVLEKAEQAQLPASRLRPTQPASHAIENLRQALPSVPTELHQFCADSLAALQRVQQAQQAGLLPETLIHGDCWPGNAVRTPEGKMALIDWDCAGIGPAILDLGYLLLTCHLGRPQLPAMRADEQAIAAVVRSYCQQRQPGSAEVDILEDALLYDIARRVGLERPLSTLSDEWRQEIWLQKMLSRYRVAPQIAASARHYLKQETTA